MADERKRKLDELKRRNAEAKAKLANSTLIPNNSSSTQNSNTGMITNTNTNTSTNSNSSTLSRVDQIILEATNRTPADVNIARHTQRLSRLGNDGYLISKFTESIIGIVPEVYEEGVQCEFGSDNEGSDDEEEKEKQPKITGNKGHRMSVAMLKKNNIGIMSNKKGGENLNSFNIDEKIFGDKNEENINTNINTNTHINLKTGTSKMIVNEELRRQVLNSQELSDFLGTKSKYVERALGEKEIYDMFKTYYDEDDTGDQDLSKRALVSPALEFFDENCTGRAVTSIEWSLKHQELLLAAYSKSDDFNINQSNGLINLWSLALRKTPEFTFSCQTEITSAIFHKFIPKLVIGATYTGQILLWDTRGKQLPVQKTPPGGKFHSHPIYCLGVTGTANANNIISVSNDGVLCTWSLNNLSKPTKRIDLKAKKRKQGDNMNDNKMIDRNYSEEIGAICLATQENETNNIFLGADDSDIYQIYVHQSNDNVDNVVETYKKHTGPIHSLDMHPGDYHKNSNFSHLMLSASADWTVNLWSKNLSDSPLFTFDNNDDYVYDAKFHPTNPSLFASIDGLGKLDFWDLNKDVEVPIYRYDVGKNSLNKMGWSQDGKRVAVGDITGKVSILNVDKEIYNSKVEDSLKFDKLISAAKNNKKGF